MSYHIRNDKLRELNYVKKYRKQSGFYLQDSLCFLSAGMNVDFAFDARKSNFRAHLQQ